MLISSYTMATHGDLNCFFFLLGISSLNYFQIFFLIFKFFFTFWEVLVAIPDVKLTASFKPRSFICTWQDFSPAPNLLLHCAILWIFQHVVALKHQKLCGFGFPLIWCTCETAHSALWFWCIYAFVLERYSKFPSCIWNLDYQHVNFKVLRVSQRVQQRLSISLYLTSRILSGDVYLSWSDLSFLSWLIRVFILTHIQRQFACIWSERKRPCLGVLLQQRTELGYGRNCC